MKNTIGFPYTLLGFFCIIISCSHLRILRLRTIIFVTQQYSAGGYIIYLLLISLKYNLVNLKSELWLSSKMGVTDYKEDAKKRRTSKNYVKGNR